MPKAKPVKRVLNCIPSRGTERDWRFQHADQAGLLEARRAAIPASKDLRTAWWRVGNQGGSGSCVGWATADSVLRWHFVKSGRLKQRERLSPRFTWMASKETDQFISQPTTFIEVAGTSLKSALDVSRKYGAVREQVLPFASGKLFTGEEEAFYARAARFKVASYFNLTLRRASDIDEWRRWIATNGPILTRLDVDRTWDEAGDNKGNLDTYRPETARGGHAIALVGYTPDRFVVRNSWGTSWGDGGFGYASLAYAQDAFTEAYGVSV
ncbi:MAG: C1 family peptidase [Thermoleophilaceae bacterium]